MCAVTSLGRAGTESRRVGTEFRLAGTELRRAGTELRHAGTESNRAGTELRLLLWSGSMLYRLSRISGYKNEGYRRDNEQH